MIDHATQSALLDRYPTLRDLSAPLQEELFSRAALLQLPQGAMVFDEDQACQGFPLLLSGSVRVIKAAPNGRELQLYRIEPGESCILTSSCLLGNARDPARGVAEQDLQLVVLPPGVFRTLVAASEPFRNYVFNLFSDRLADMMQLVSAVAFQKLDQRLAALLVSRPSPICATHQALADELGSVREMVSRLLKGFADRGWVKLAREQIEIIDAPALRQIAEL